jgi:hypothetical protein
MPRTPKIFIRLNCLNNKRGRMPPATMTSRAMKNRLIGSLSVRLTQLPGYILALAAPGFRKLRPFFKGYGVGTARVNGYGVIQGTYFKTMLQVNIRIQEF